jgi:hypothetical protein
VWFFENGAFHLHELRDDGYHAISSSALVPGLDFDVLARCAEIEDQHAALAALRAWMQGGAGHG